VHARRLARAATILALTALATACSGSSKSLTPPSAGADIIIAANLPLSGDRASFGRPMQLGYQQAVDEVNAAGGLDLGGGTRKVKLEIADDRSDPTLAAQQARDAYQQGNAVAMLGSANPPLNNPISAVAEQVHKPLVVTSTPIEPWLNARPDGYLWAWDIFFTEEQRTEVPFQAADLLQSNKQVALITDTEQDGAIMGRLWAQQAPKFGYRIVYQTQVPIGSAEFSSQISALRSVQAEVLIAKLRAPDAAELWKQMKALGYVPKAAFCEECAITDSWFRLLGRMAAGTLEADFWSPSLPLPDAETFADKYAPQFGGRNGDLSVLVSAYSAAKVLLDAVAAARSTQPGAINDMLTRTNNTYPIGPVKFAANHSAAIRAIVTQWADRPDVQRVWPTDPPGATPIQSPPAGLQ
jgi:branched-chain amino acid transport system substrate-binding protein